MKEEEGERGLQESSAWSWVLDVSKIIGKPFEDVEKRKFQIIIDY